VIKFVSDLQQVGGFIRVFPKQLVLLLAFTQFWFPLLISVIVSFSVRLPRHKDLTNTPSSGQLHLLTKKAHFVAVYYYKAILYRYGTFGTSFVVALQREGADKNNISCDRWNECFDVIKGLKNPFPCIWDRRYFQTFLVQYLIHLVNVHKCICLLFGYKNA
jgi:hypothetical protein